MKKLLQGIADFRQKSLLEYRNKFAQLALKQMPDALFVACCDSRVVPNTFASSDPGDLFVLRNIGNLIPPYCPNYAKGTSVSATIEYAVNSLQVQDIIICGHSECGAMNALLSREQKPNSLTDNAQPCLNAWLDYGVESYKRLQNSPESKIASTEDLSVTNLLSQINVLQQIEHLKTYPMVQEKLALGKLRLHGWWFELETADVYYYDSQKNKFILLDETSIDCLLNS